MSYRSVLARVLVLLITAGFGQPGWAKKKPDMKYVRAAIKLFDATANIPVPGWQKSLDASHDSRIIQKRNKTDFLLEFIPKREKFERWTRLYAVRAEKNLKLSLAVAYKAQLAVYVRSCGLGGLKQQILKKSARLVFFVLFCPSSARGPKKFGYGPEVGEISLFWMAKHKATLVKVYHHWRGPRFDLKNMKSWPVSKAHVQDMIARFAAITLK